MLDVGHRVHRGAPQLADSLGDAVHTRGRGPTRSRAAILAWLPTGPPGRPGDEPPPPPPGLNFCPIPPWCP
jgi:hypothetical protein